MPIFEAIEIFLLQCPTMCFSVVHYMKTIIKGKPAKRETGIRLWEDQIHKLDLLVDRSRGRRKRSQFISEAIDEFLDRQLRSLNDGRAA